MWRPAYPAGQAVACGRVRRHIAGAPRPTPTVAAVVDLLGMLAYGELLAFDRMAADAQLAPDLPRRAVLSEMAGVGDRQLPPDRRRG